MLTYLAKDSLSQFSLFASELWTDLEEATTPEEEEGILSRIWETQSEQEKAIDTHAELADQLDAEIAAVTARKEFLLNLHDKAIERLQRWRNSLDATVLRLHSFGELSANAVGQTRQIVIKENPPTCEVLIEPKELPEEYRNKAEKITYTPNKQKIKAAWAKGIPVDGTRVYKKQKVEYRLTASSSHKQTAVFTERAEQPTIPQKNGKKK